ncbi:hypothetical protein F511_42174 [Dorcoceras hygrometricum]|uniref:Uncharacterized protein n=1 Tax=Dorcoceras hygrometricum TaxID=472368 RepID=A0A2Z7A0F3_9LAMI|nr:hypothetical protein F511_42174 [Dorcoceras hygrometricum]
MDKTSLQLPTTAARCRKDKLTRVQGFQARQPSVPTVPQSMPTAFNHPVLPQSWPAIVQHRAALESNASQHSALNLLHLSQHICPTVLAISSPMRPSYPA